MIGTVRSRSSLSQINQRCGVGEVGYCESTQIVMNLATECAKQVQKEYLMLYEAKLLPLAGAWSIVFRSSCDGPREVNFNFNTPLILHVLRPYRYQYFPIIALLSVIGTFCYSLLILNVKV